jgi:hypothetical protein
MLDMSECELGYFYVKHISSLSIEHPYQGKFRQLERLSSSSATYEPAQDWFSADARDMDVKAQSVSTRLKTMLQEQVAVFIASGVAILVCQAVFLQSLLK